jgi:prepilin-type N-terminal cleavage/methylation domain-containing protein
MCVARASDVRQLRRPEPRGFTMLELLLVLALIVAISAAAMPAFFGPLENYRLRKAADMVRIRWEKLRIQAMKSGQTMMFRFQVGGNRCQGGPWSSGEDVLESSQFMGGAFQAGMVAPGPGMVPSNSGDLEFEEEMPERVMFVGVESAVSVRDAMIQQMASAMTGPNQAPEDQAWSPPILFYPDGTTSTVRLVLQNQQQQFIMLQLRGLTGVTTVSDLMVAEELPP